MPAPLFKRALGYVGSALDIASQFTHGGAFNRNKVRTPPNPIKETVDNAKAAGIHPLFALGTGANYSPATETGSAFGNYAQAAGRLAHGFSGESEARQSMGDDSVLRQAQIAAVRASAQRDTAAAMESNSQTALNAQRLYSIGRDNTNVVDSPTLGSFTTPPVQVVGARPNNPTVSAGPNQPSGVAVTMPDGSVQIIPNQVLMDSELPGAEFYIRRFGNWLGQGAAKIQLGVQRHVQRKLARTRAYRKSHPIRSR